MRTGRDITESQIIGSRIREVRVKKGMSQAELAAKANISLPHISDLELGKSRMMLASFVRITEALQASADSLLRPDIPEMKNLSQSEFADILDDCTPAKIDSILKIVKELKTTMHKKNEY